ncbi:transcription termination factor NusA [bacterium]|nr:transcription termination factor NusA [bacterium]
MDQRTKARAARAHRSEFSSAIAQICAERKIDAEQVYQAIEAGLLGAYRKQVGGETDEPLDPKFYYWAQVDRDSGAMKILCAPRLQPDVEEDESYDDKKITEVTPPGFGRIAAQLAKQIILQRMRDAERDQIISEYQSQIGTVVTGQVFRMERDSVLMDIGRGNASMPPVEQMRGEFYKSGARMAVLIKGIGEVNGKRTIIVSRADAQLVALLFEREVPEISGGSVQIKLIAREAGIRTKVAVASNNPAAVDPVGSCVGQRGVRVQEIIKELNNEKIDIIPYFEDPVQMIIAALAPAENMTVEYDAEAKAARVSLPKDQVPLAIGRGGQNVRLAAKLVGASITVVDEAGEIKGQVTGSEEYEIDQFELAPEVRERLVNLKLTNSNDILRFQNRLENCDDIDAQTKAAIVARAQAQVDKDTSENVLSRDIADGDKKSDKKVKKEKKSKKSEQTEEA